MPEQTYRRFMLGLASVDEESIAEEAILRGEVEPSFLHDVEDGLIDDYVLGGLTGEERIGFTKYFLVGKERSERVAFASAVVEYARQHGDSRPSLRRDHSPKSNVLSAFYWKWSSLAATAAVVLLVAVLGRQQIELGHQRQIATDSREELARLRVEPPPGPADNSVPDASRPIVTAVPKADRLAMPAIVFGAVTRGVMPVVLRIPQDVEFVRIDCKLPSPLAERYRESIVRASGEQLWTQEFSASALLLDQLSRIAIPATILTSGMYHFRVEKASLESKFEMAEDHVFRVEKQ